MAGSNHAQALKNSYVSGILNELKTDGAPLDLASLNQTLGTEKSQQASIYTDHDTGVRTYINDGQPFRHNIGTGEDKVKRRFTYEDKYAAYPLDHFTSDDFGSGFMDHIPGKVMGKGHGTYSAERDDRIVSWDDEVKMNKDGGRVPLPMRRGHWQDLINPGSRYVELK